MRRTVLILWVGLCSILPTSAEAAATPSCGEVVDGAAELCGTTTFPGEVSGVAPVRISESARLNMNWHAAAGGPNDDVKITGAGRYVGIAITHDPPRFDEAWSSNVIIAARFGRCASAGCDPGNDAFSFIWPAVPGDAPPEFLTLAPGRYRVYLTVDGAPAAVTMTLAGLQGAGTVDTASPASAFVRTPTTRVSAGGPGFPTLYTAGDRVSIPGPGFSLGTIWVTSAESPGVPIGGEFGDCLHDSAANVDERLLYGPHCLAYTHAFPLFDSGSGLVHMSDADRATIFTRLREDGWGDAHYGLWYSSPMPLIAAMTTIVNVDF